MKKLNYNKRNIKTICYVTLGKYVIEINVDDDQLEDRLDETYNISHNITMMVYKERI